MRSNLLFYTKFFYNKLCLKLHEPAITEAFHPAVNNARGASADLGDRIRCVQNITSLSKVAFQG